MYSNILLPVDLSHKSSWKQAIPVALEYAKAFGAKIHIMTVIPDSGMAIVSQYFSPESVNEIIDETNKSLQKFAQKHIPKTVKSAYIVKTGNVYESIINTAKEINSDLIIMSAHRPELKDYLLGPNAARVVRHSDRSVLVIREKA